MTTTMTPATEQLLAATTFDATGLVPVIAQDARTGGVRMFAWANREALALTAATGQGHFFSRSRQALWRKGESSGHGLAVREIRIDCDGDVVLYLVDADGPSCHTGSTSCFFRKLNGEASDGEASDGKASDGKASDGANGEATAANTTPAASVRSDRAATTPAALVEDDGPPDPPAVVVARVAAVIARRHRERPEKSYVVSLLDAGWPKILGKIAEEAGELAESLPGDDRAHTAHEAADLIFHVLVGLEAAGVPLDDVFGQLRRRFGVSGIDEKASRAR